MFYLSYVKLNQEKKKILIWINYVKKKPIFIFYYDDNYTLYIIDLFHSFCGVLIKNNCSEI